MIIQSSVKKLQSSGTLNFLTAELCFPYIIIFENKRNVRVLNITKVEETETEEQNNLHSFEDEILNYVVRGQHIWMVLRSSKIFILNVNRNTLLEIKCISYANYKIRKFASYGSKLILISESGERVYALLSNEALEDEFNKGTEVMEVAFEKTSSTPQKRASCNNVRNLRNETCLDIDSGQLTFKCETTGLVDVLTNEILQHTVQWHDLNVISNKTEMWVLDQSYNLIFKFENADYQYYPLGESNNFLHYLEWNHKEIGVNYASTSSSQEQGYSPNTIDIQKKLSSQETLKLQLSAEVEQAISGNTQPEKILPKLQMLFNDIEDFSYLMDIATKLCKHSLSYRTTLYPLQKRIHETSDQNLLDNIYDILVKTDLLEYITFRGGNLYNDLNIFDMNFVQLCVTFMSKSDSDLASICWLKYSEKKPTVNLENIKKILDAIPQNIKLGALVIWFRNFIPPLLEQNPFYIDLFVKWSTDRVFLLEQSSYWPKIGLKFISTIVEVLESSMKTICVRPIAIDDLDVIKDHINYILELKEKYKINMMLSEFSSQSPSEIAQIMLRRCYTEDLAAYLQESLLSYASRFVLEIDDILRSFIDSEAASCGGSIDGDRLKILLNAFHSPTYKLECLLNVLKVLDVPWNPTVISIATNAAAQVHKDFTISEADLVLAKEINIELNCAKIKVILKKYNFPLTCNDYTLVIHKLINASTVDLEDLKEVTLILSEYANYANTLYIDKCLRDCVTKSALVYLKNLSHRSQRILIKTIQYKYEQIITGINSNPLLERNYIDFLKGSSLLDSIEINNLENLYYLKNSYNIKLDLDGINNNKTRTNALKNLKQNEDVLSSSGRGRCISQLISKDVFKQSKLISILRRTSSSQGARKLVESLVLGCGQDVAILSEYKNGQNSALLLESYDILSEVVCSCVEEHLHHLLKYLAILYALIHASIILKNLSVAWKFQYIFLPMSSINGLNELINFYSSFSPKQIIEPEMSEILLKSDLIPFRAFAQIVHWSIQTETTISDMFCKMRDKISKRLISKITTLQDFDQILVTSLLLTLKSTDTIDDKMWILELMKGQSESLTPHAMNYLSSPTIRRTFELESILPASTMSYPPQYILKTKFNINLCEIFGAENTDETCDERVLLFYYLRHYPQTTFERVIELCHTLDVSSTYGLSLLLISLLANWDLKYKIDDNDLGYRQLIIEDEGTQMLQKCLMLWQSIDNKKFIIDVLNDFWKNGEVVIHGSLVSVNPYYYEIYLCIYCLLFSESRNLKEFYLLHFLKGYQRKSTPKQYEFELFSAKGMFPEIGHYRLPFQLFMRDDMWSNLKSEITLETFERWLPVVALLALNEDLQISKDMICSNAVKQTMTNRKSQEGNNVDTKDIKSWRLTSLEEPLLRTAHRCVSFIANMEWAGACLFYVLQGCARGADQVAAAQLCYQFSQRWATVQPDNRAVKQMDKLHTTLSTRHALHKIEWACEELIKLTTEPIQLIKALYLHYNFVEKIARHDINRTANEIADRNNINISSIRMQILENMLDKTHKEKNSAPGLDTKDLITAKYILKATCPKMRAIYLSRIAFDDESDYKCKKLRALQCLMSVIEPETAIKVSYRERDVLWSSLLELLYIVNLEKIDMPWVVATFMQNKTVALNQLIQVSSSNTKSLQIAAELAHKFGTIQNIRDLIPMLLRASLLEEMIPLLLRIQSPPDNIIYSAWRAIILSPFQRADYPITDRQKAKCLQALNLLPVCPVIKDEDLVEIWKNCIRCKCLSLGCLLLPYMAPKTRQSLTELQRIDKRSLIIGLKNLISESYLVSGAIYVLDNLTTRTYK